jgi:hypothetical protein
MAGILHAGYIAKPGEDIFPTTGPHLDVRVKKGGQYIDPSTWRSGLQNLLIGEQKTPLYQQTKGGFNPAFTVTSGYGARKAPTAGASTFHKGIDFGIPGGTPLYWKGAGAFKPGKGLGTIQTPEGFEIELLHTKGGKEVALGPQTPQLPPPQQPAAVDAPQSINILIQTGKEEEEEERISPQQQLKNYVDKMFGSVQSPINPMSLAKMITNQPTAKYF